MKGIYNATNIAFFRQLWSGTSMASPQTTLKSLSQLLECLCRPGLLHALCCQPLLAILVTPLSQVGAPLGMGPLSLTPHPSSTWGRAPTCLDSERRSVYYGAWLLWNISLSDNFLFQHLKRLVKPTDRYYRWLDLSNRAYWKGLHKSHIPRNEHLESGGSGTNAHNTSTRAWFESGRYFWPMNNE